MGWFSLRLAQADAWFRRGTLEALARAVDIAPANTDYAAFRALQLEYEGEDPVPTLERVVKLNPYASGPRIRLGLFAEIHGNFDIAEKWLLDAARVDRQFEPAWTLANFYFRHGRREEFWNSIQQALNVSYGSRKPVFDLCWRMSDDSGEILTRAIPNRREVLAAYLHYLREGSPRRLAASFPVALKLAAGKDPLDLPLLSAACESFLLERMGGAARELRRVTTSDAPLGLLMNGDFVRPPRDFCFDWEPPNGPGLQHLFIDQPPRLRILMSGQQQETTRLLGQYVNLEAKKVYVLRWETRTEGVTAPSGIGWSIGESPSASIAPSEDWMAGEATFTAATDLLHLSLIYKRPAGQPRVEGYIECRHVRIAEAK
jgi:hypothetical protein